MICPCQNCIPTINAGTSGNPIIFQTDGGVVNLTYSSGDGPIIGSNNKEYIEWDGFSVDNATAPRAIGAGNCVFFNYANHCAVRNCTLDGNDDGYTGNYNGVRVEDCWDITISNNTIHHYGPNDAGNNTGVQLYQCGRVTIAHNTIYSCGTGIQLKALAESEAEVADVDWIEVYQNHCYDLYGNGVYVFRAPCPADGPARIYQNIFEMRATAGYPNGCFCTAECHHPHASATGRRTGTGDRH